MSTNKKDTMNINSKSTNSTTNNNTLFNEFITKWDLKEHLANKPSDILFSMKDHNYIGSVYNVISPIEKIFNETSCPKILFTYLDLVFTFNAKFYELKKIYNESFLQRLSTGNSFLLSFSESDLIDVYLACNIFYRYDYLSKSKTYKSEIADITNAINDKAKINLLLWNVSLFTLYYLVNEINYYYKEQTNANNQAIKTSFKANDINKISYKKNALRSIFSYKPKILHIEKTLTLALIEEDETKQQALFKQFEKQAENLKKAINSIRINYKKEILSNKNATNNELLFAKTNNINFKIWLLNQKHSALNRIFTDYFSKEKIYSGHFIIEPLNKAYPKGFLVSYSEYSGKKLLIQSSRMQLASIGLVDPAGCLAIRDIMNVAVANHNHFYTTSFLEDNFIYGKDLWFKQDESERMFCLLDEAYLDYNAYYDNNHLKSIALLNSNNTKINKTSQQLLDLETLLHNDYNDSMFNVSGRWLNKEFSLQPAEEETNNKNQNNSLFFKIKNSNEFSNTIHKNKIENQTYEISNNDLFSIWANNTQADIIDPILFFKNDITANETFYLKLFLYYYLLVGKLYSKEQMEKINNINTPYHTLFSNHLLYNVFKTKDFKKYLSDIDDLANATETFCINPYYINVKDVNFDFFLQLLDDYCDDSFSNGITSKTNLKIIKTKHSINHSKLDNVPQTAREYNTLNAELFVLLMLNVYRLEMLDKNNSNSQINKNEQNSHLNYTEIDNFVYFSPKAMLDIASLYYTIFNQTNFKNADISNRPLDFVRNVFIKSMSFPNYIPKYVTIYADAVFKIQWKAMVFNQLFNWFTSCKLDEKMSDLYYFYKKNIARISKYLPQCNNFAEWILFLRSMNNKYKDLKVINTFLNSNFKQKYDLLDHLIVIETKKEEENDEEDDV